MAPVNYGAQSAPRVDAGKRSAVPAKKRKGHWACGGAANQMAEQDPLSSSAPEPKRPHLDESDAKGIPMVPQEPSNSSLFGMPTGRLSDRFELCGKTLGAGQFGTVRECNDSLTNERLACKSIRKLSSGAEQQLEELRNEVNLMMRLGGHENVVQLRGVFEEESEVHLVMDFCEGGELFQELMQRHRFCESDAALVFTEMVKAVAFCHSRGVLHRDLKPENILLTQEFRDIAAGPLTQAQGPMVKLADFGLATWVAPGSSIKGVAGSPFYMAPEVLTGEYSFKADVWSLGVILYILLSGSPPFWGENDEDVFKAVLTGKPDLVSPPWNTVSDEAKRLIKCLLVQDPTRRPSAHRILTHPWLLKHAAAHRSDYSVEAAVEPIRVV